eukprot:gene7943-10034_t
MASDALPIVVVSAFFCAAGLYGTLVAGRKSNDRGLIHTMWLTTALCLWLFWICAYLAQLNPLIGPELKAKEVCVSDGTRNICT